MSYPLFSGSPAEVSEPPVIGGDIEFLLDTPAGHTVASIGDIADMVEADMYDTMPTTLSESKVYMLTRDMFPRQVFVAYRVVKTDCKSSSEGPRYHLKTVRLIDIDGGVVAEAPYRVYPEAP